MARCVRIFGSECWSEGVAIGKTDCEGLYTQLTTDSKESWLREHIFLVVDKLILKRHRSKVEQVIIVSSSLLLLFILLWLLSLSSILCGLSFFSCLLLFLLCFDFLSGFWSFQFVLQFSLRNWLIGFWKCGGHLEHFSGTFTIRSGNDWSMDV